MTNLDTLATSFEDVASRYPEACAMRWNGGSWTYAELNARANKLAHFLVKQGLELEEPVGVFAARSPECLAAYLAILKAGGAYVPLDPSYPPERIEYYLNDSGAKWVLADPAEVSRLPSSPAKTVLLNGDLAKDQPDTNPPGKTGLDSLAHILYTSGSTGRPKGVLIEQRGVLRLTQYADDYMKIGPGETLLQFAPLSFDISTFEIWAVWLKGACLAVPPAGLASLHDLGRAIQSFQVTCMTLTASLMALMVEQEIESLAGLRQLLSGGDVVSPVHAERFLRKYPDSRLINAYGPTENSVLTSCQVVALESPMPTRLSIGRPIQKTGVLILNDKLQPVPQGEVGEMVMTGEGVARGYLNQPELTARSFVEVRDASGQKVRGYRSGDLGRYNADGTLDFQGRVDDQVKINGVRIEPGEIKNILQAHPQVAGAEVLVVESEGKKRLETFVVPRPGVEVDERLLRDYLGQKIPGNWLPPVLRVIASLPLSPNGKVDRPALLATLPATQRTNTPDADTEPQDHLEKAIWNIWQDVLPGIRISRRDYFSDLGGDSLSAMYMIAQVEKMLGRPLGLRSLLEGGTIVDVANAARDTGPVSPPPLMICTQVGTRQPPFFFAHGDYVCGGLYCQKMAHTLGPEHSLYAFAPHGTFGGELLPSFKAVAADYVRLIRTVQPEGPYNLGGFCNGAVAMYEVAQQLIEAGETVAALILLDPPDLYFFLLRRRINRFGQLIGLPEGKSRALYKRIAEGVEIWQSDGLLRLTGDFFKRIGVYALKHFRRLCESKQEGGPPSPPNLNFHYYEVMADYEPKPYLGTNPAWIILRQGERERWPKQISYWKGLIPHAAFEYIPGTHLELKTRMVEITDIIKKAVKTSGA